MARKLSPKMLDVLLYIAATPAQREALDHPGRATNTCAALVTRGLITPGRALTDHALTDSGREILAEAAHLVLHVEPAPVTTPAPVALTARAAGLLGCFKADGTYTEGGGADHPAGPELIKHGLIERIGRHPLVYRITDAGRAHPAARLAGEVPTVAAMAAATDSSAERTHTCDATCAAFCRVVEAREMVDTWARQLGDDESGAIAYAMRIAFRHLADPTRGGRDPELAAAALAELDRRFPPRYVTVPGDNGAVWHLTNHDGQPVEAGEYSSPIGVRFTIAEHPDVQRWENHTAEPRKVYVNWADGDGRHYANAGDLVAGWHWTPEWPEHGVRSI